MIFFSIQMKQVLRITVLQVLLVAILVNIPGNSQYLYHLQKGTRNGLRHFLLELKYMVGGGGGQCDQKKITKCL